ncbi:copper chaperone [Acinetobacter chinensis]|uniref:Copper chaperone n=1 Tax=Acinetobacter chinensis TaxID=2004650 RepID=A0A3B7LXI0_9GAMM|nr:MULTISPECIES: heavy-metal-associated domain-containing protein [Acinetobacter]AXY57610.1 copper chaperone [Acinetobacter chinensis]AXY60907.1 copper chaperone [Acinetobacter sp. WCHAc010052]MDV2467487.1 heavy-metal-associated domain-containing protein [Acinetobacter chinensis]WOE43298.1 heavy-metal-associated domain-containing protein [Acinetobacter chinensis]
MKLYVENMTCGGCARGVTASLKELDENATVNIDIPNKLVDIETQQDTAAVVAALAEDGWKAQLK